MHCAARDCVAMETGGVGGKGRGWEVWQEAVRVRVGGEREEGPSFSG